MHAAALPGILGPPQAGASYVDPNFGGRVRVITAAPIYHTYSTPSPLSAHQKYLMSYLENGTWEIVDAATARVVFRRNPCNQSYFWDATDDEVYYYFQGAAVLKHDLRTNKSSVLIDYSKQPEQFHEIVRGGTGDSSKDNWISFWAPDDKTICALDIDHLKTYCADYADSQRNLAYGDVDFTLDLQRHRQDQRKALRHAGGAARDGNIFRRSRGRRPETGIPRPGESRETRE